MKTSKHTFIPYRHRHTLTAETAPLFRRGARWLGLAVCLAVSACGGDTSGTVQVNQSSGLELPVPDFLQARAILSTNLDARVSADIDGVTYQAKRTQPGLPWVGELFVPEGNNAALTVEWVEREVPDLPDDMEGELLLATYSTTLTNVQLNMAVVIETEQFITQGTVLNPRPSLDIDADGFSNLVERQSGSRPNDASDKPAEVTILFNASSPVIDGRYDAIWNNAQFLDSDRNALNIDKLMIDRGVTEPDEDRKYKWAGMHDGRYLYLLIFGEQGEDQTPFGDSTLDYNDDAIEVFWDADYSRQLLYDGVDDFHVVIPLLSAGDAPTENRSDIDTARFSLGANSTPIERSAVDFGVCLCSGSQQIYELRIDLAVAKIPLDTIFGFEIQIDNDVNGGERDAKWAWFDDTGGDNTWRFPFRMGSARLEPVPR